MRALIVTMTLLTAVPVLADPPQRERGCTRPGIIETAERDGVELRRLDQLPRAKLFLTLYREVDGCPAPLVVRNDIGAVPHR